MKKLILPLFCLVILSACNSEPSQDKAQESQPPTQEVQQKQDPPSEKSKVQKGLPDNDYDMVFEEYEEEPEFWRELRCLRTKEGLEFKITTRNPGRGCESIYFGSAKLKDGDLESRDTQDGESLFVNEYVHETADCELYIAIDIDTESIAWVSQGSCPVNEKGCPFDTGVPMPRIP